MSFMLNQKYDELEEENPQTSGFLQKAIDRFGPVRGQVCDRSSDRSPLDPSYSEGECQEDGYYSESET